MSEDVTPPPSASVHLAGLSQEDRALIARVPEHERRANGIPAPEDASRRQRAALLAHESLAPWLHPDGLRFSPLGAGWSSDLDAHVTVAPPATELEALGWLPLDHLLDRVGAPGSGRWGIVADGEVLTRLDLHRSPRPDPVDQVVRRIRRRREVRVREVLELRMLRREGHPLRRHPALTLAADAERTLGGDQLADLASHEDVGRPPVPFGGRRGPRRLAMAVRRSAATLSGRRRAVIGISGIDGSGKSTLIANLREDLRRLGIRSDQVWTRPGMRLRLLERVARMGRRVLGQGEEPTVRQVAEEPQDPRRAPSRRGALGWIWALLVTLSYLWDTWRRTSVTRGVVLFDRHALDALVTLEVVYGGAVDLTFHRALVRALLPRADLTLLLDLPAEVADARKPDDLFAGALERQLRRYERLEPIVRNLVRLDATASPVEVAADAREALARSI